MTSTNRYRAIREGIKWADDDYEKLKLNVSKILYYRADMPKLEMFYRSYLYPTWLELTAPIPYTIRAKAWKHRLEAKALS